MLAASFSRSESASPRTRPRHLINKCRSPDGQVTSHLFMPWHRLRTNSGPEAGTDFQTVTTQVVPPTSCWPGDTKSKHFSTRKTQIHLTGNEACCPPECWSSRVAGCRGCYWPLSTLWWSQWPLAPWWPVCRRPDSAQRLGPSPPQPGEQPRHWCWSTW